MDKPRFSLKLYKTLSDRVKCYSCGANHSASLYIDNATGLELAPHVMRCNKENSCGYHYTPKMYFEENPDSVPKGDYKPEPPAPPQPPDYIDNEVTTQSFKAYNDNSFTLFLKHLVGRAKALELIKEYHIGTVQDSFNKNDTIFWQVDMQGLIRGGKIIKYNFVNSAKTQSKKDCKRDKTTKYDCLWTHKKGFNLIQCYYGVHLLNKYLDKKVIIVEGEKTAILGSIYLPQYVWIACGGEGDLLGKDCMKAPALKGREVLLFPDLSKPPKDNKETALEKWTRQMDRIQFFAKSVKIISLSDFASSEDIDKQNDIADFLLKLSIPTAKESKEKSVDEITGELVAYYLTDTKFLGFEGFTVDGINIDSLPFDVGFHLGVLANPTPDQINESLQFIQDNQALFDASPESRPAFRLGYNYGLINSNQEKEYSIKILSIIKTQIEK